MFPLKDDNPAELPPIVTVALILVTGAVWLLVQGAGFSQEAMLSSVCNLGAIPAEITGGAGAWDQSPCQAGGLRIAPLFTSMFLHGGWGHLIGNMWFLWIFGNNVEDSMGHLRFLLFYVLCGLAAAGAHVMADPSSTLPMVGASGAISAIMGAYLLLYPKAKVKTVIFIIIFFSVVELPAFLYLGYWFLLQLFGVLGPAVGGGVAFWAHIGGFVAGLVLILVFRNPRLVRAKRAHVTLPRDEIRFGGWI
ncbi:MAG: rhomboid family intramembrane serine protease [Gemmatimonadota bacterium]|jgi:membrane associated rhomboid family serine protease